MFFLSIPFLSPFVNYQILSGRVEISVKSFLILRRLTYYSYNQPCFFNAFFFFFLFFFAVSRIFRTYKGTSAMFVNKILILLDTDDDIISQQLLFTILFFFFFFFLFLFFFKSIFFFVSFLSFPFLFFLCLRVMCRQLPSCSLFNVVMYKNRKFVERNILHI